MIFKSKTLKPGEEQRIEGVGSCEETVELRVRRGNPGELQIKEIYVDSRPQFVRDDLVFLGTHFDRSEIRLLLEISRINVEILVKNIGNNEEQFEIELVSSQRRI